MEEFTVLSGEAYTVRADDPDQAREKFFAWLDGQTCPCGTDECECVEYSETMTVTI